jgi:cytidine deaminase
MADMSRLLKQARRAAESSYSPYSHFRVEAALLCKDGTVVTGTVSTPDSTAAVAPCGACRQVLSEFVKADFPVTFAGTDQRVDSTLGKLYPFDSLQELKNRGCG